MTAACTATERLAGRCGPAAPIVCKLGTWHFRTRRGALTDLRCNSLRTTVDSTFQLATAVSASAAAADAASINTWGSPRRSSPAGARSTSASLFADAPGSTSGSRAHMASLTSSCVAAPAGMGGGEEGLGGIAVGDACTSEAVAGSSRACSCAGLTAGSGGASRLARLCPLDDTISAANAACSARWACSTSGWDARLRSFGFVSSAVGDLAPLFDPLAGWITRPSSRRRAGSCIRHARRYVASGIMLPRSRSSVSCAMPHSGSSASREASALHSRSRECSEGSEANGTSDETRFERRLSSSSWCSRLYMTDSGQAGHTRMAGAGRAAATSCARTLAAEWSRGRIGSGRGTSARAATG
eukprot:scaffold240310_cov26-Tisochrysis_lutea.AAC.4